LLTREGLHVSSPAALIGQRAHVCVERIVNLADGVA
jgi:hypothetical protein